jgi:hypothetical protein
MASINLLPDELKPSGYISTLGVSLRKATVVLGTVLIVGGVLGGVAYGVLYTQVTSMKDKNTALSTEIKVLEATEQKLALLKDRLTKVQLILAKDDVQSVRSLLSDLKLTLAEDSFVSEAKIKPHEVETTVVFPSADESLAFAETAKRRSQITKIDLVSYEAQDIGYAVRLKIQVK